MAQKAVKVKVIDKGWNKIKAQAIVLAKGKVCAIGIQGSAAELESAEHGPMTNAELAAIHEFGAPKAGVPQRSFIRSTIDENKDRYQEELNRIGSGFYAGESVEQSLLLAGERVKKDIIDKINSKIPPPLSPITIERKHGETTPLVKSGQLRNSLSAQIRDATEFKGEATP